ncbi:MAG: hypothetical protein KDB82_09530 [Planctomycetes bacterium]|nr:hypothetical protein [Planctomycetota bacterium]
MKGSHIGMILALAATLAVIGVGGWWVLMRNPVGTPENALALYADGLASQDPADLAPCMYIDPVMVPDAAERDRRRKETADKYISVRDTVVGASLARKMSVAETKVTGVKGEEAHGEIVMVVEESTGPSRRRYIVTMVLQDEGWRVSQVAYTEEPRP